jgi:hypothetical protein
MDLQSFYQPLISAQNISIWGWSIGVEAGVEIDMK